jgi:hypothetical protein
MKHVMIKDAVSGVRDQWPQRTIYSPQFATRLLYFYVCNDFSVITYFRPAIGSASFILPVPNLPKRELAFAVSAG